MDFDEAIGIYKQSVMEYNAESTDTIDPEDIQSRYIWAQNVVRQHEQYEQGAPHATHPPHSDDLEAARILAKDANRQYHSRKTEEDVIRWLKGMFTSAKVRRFHNAMDVSVEADDTIAIETGHAETCQVFEIKVKEIQT